MIAEGADGESKVVLTVIVTVDDPMAGCPMTLDYLGVEEVPVEREQSPVVAPAQRGLVGVRAARHLKLSRRAEAVTVAGQDFFHRSGDGFVQMETGAPSAALCRRREALPTHAARNRRG